ncbi:MAG: hypothetical protein QOJ56_3499, partial [Mycobacterium sp.]|nr:hypothetical protein [Mycobacterium sp.]
NPPSPDNCLTVPQFRNWNVTTTCDNGTSTQATTYF